MSGAKYYVWASGAWREVQTSGRVAGWQRRPRFLFVRRGRLQLAPRGVLRALAAHAAGRPSAVRDAARLSQRSFVHGYKSTEAPAVGARVCCDNPHRGAVVSCNAARVDASTQASSTHAQTLTLNIPTQKKDTSDEDFQRKPNLRPGPRIRSERRVQSRADKHTHTKRSLSSSSSSSASHRHFVADKYAAKTTAPIKNVISPNKIKNVVDSESASEVPVKSKPMSKIQLADQTKDNLGKLVNSNQSNRDGDNRQKLKQPCVRKTRGEVMEDEPGPKRPKFDRTTSKPTPMTITKVIENLSDTTDSEPLFNKTKSISNKVGSPSDRGSPRRPPVKRRPLNTVHRRSTSSSEDMPLKDISISRGLFSRRAGGRPRRYPFLELIIPEQDVEVLRVFIERTDCADLERFDADDEYKRALFFSINPVVDIARCARLERALDETNLKRFAEGLGLCSVSEVSTQASTYKIRQRAVKATSTVLSSDSGETSSEIHRSQKDKSKQVNTDRGKKLTEKSIAQKPVRIRDSSQDTSEASTVSGDRNESINNRRKSLRARDTSRELNRNIGQQMLNKHNVNTRTKLKAKTGKVTRNVSKNMNITNNTSGNGSDSSEDNATAPIKPRTTRSRTRNSLNKPSAGRSASTGDSFEDTNNKASISQTMKLRSKVGATSSENTKKINNDRSSRSQHRSLRSKPSVKKFETIRDSSDDTIIQPNTTRTKNSSKRPNVDHRSDTTRDSSEETGQELTKERTSRPQVGKGDRRSDKGEGKEKPRRAAESSAESKENVAQRANRPAGLHGLHVLDGPDGRLAALNSHTISNRASCSVTKEYSNLEDHAIVSWVSSGGRARRVNGNAVWRELQDHYEKLSGRERSWHSLRNRYLRYILPALPALRLPPAHAARLRAAAATGPLKSRRMQQRRNSIFEPAVRGAASRRHHLQPHQQQQHQQLQQQQQQDQQQRQREQRPATPPPRRAAPAERSVSTSAPRRSLRSSGAPPSPSPSPPARVVAASPRYSEVTRQFASRKLRSTPRSSPPPPPPPSPPAGPKSRKLYNPKSQL